MVLVILMLNISAFGQKSVDALFARYAEDDDFVTVTINANLLRLAKLMDGGDDEDDYWPANITRIRILAQGNDNRNTGNFYDMVERELDRKNYEEFMRVKKSDQDLVMLVRVQGRSYKEFLLIGGGEDNLIIQVKGNMTFKEAKRFADKMREDREVDINVNSN